MALTRTEQDLVDARELCARWQTTAEGLADEVTRLRGLLLDATGLIDDMCYEVPPLIDGCKRWLARSRADVTKK